MKFEGLEHVKQESKPTKQPQITDNDKRMILFKASKYDKNPIKEFEDRRM